jgi:hypothetical protein
MTPAGGARRRTRRSRALCSFAQGSRPEDRRRGRRRPPRASFGSGERQRDQLKRTAAERGASRARSGGQARAARCGLVVGLIHGIDRTWRPALIRRREAERVTMRAMARVSMRAMIPSPRQRAARRRARAPASRSTRAVLPDVVRDPGQQPAGVGVGRLMRARPSGVFLGPFKNSHPRDNTGPGGGGGGKNLNILRFRWIGHRGALARARLKED